MFSLAVPNDKAADDQFDCPSLLKAQNLSCQFLLLSYVGFNFSF